MEKVKKSGFEVKTEVEDIVANMDGVIDALCLIDSAFALDNETLSKNEAMYLVANHATIRNVHNLVETQLREIADKLAAINLEKDLDPEATENAN